LAQDLDVAELRALQAQSAFEQRRLAGAVLAQEAQDRAGRQCQVDFVEHPLVAEAFRNAAQLEHRFTHCRAPLIESRGPPTLAPVSGPTDTPWRPPVPAAAAAHAAVP